MQKMKSKENKMNKEEILYEISISYNIYSKGQGVVYCLDEKFKDIAIAEIGKERLKKYLKG